MDIEKRLEEAKSDYKSRIVMPDNIDSYIQSGIEKRKKPKVFKNIMKIAACFILVFLVSIKLSPTFAEAVSEIPFLNKIVELIHNDKSLQYAVDNEYVQPIGNYDEHEDIRFMVNHIIADESSVFIFYNVKNNSEHKKLRFIVDALLDENGNGLSAAYTWSDDVDEEKKNKEALGMIDVTFSNEAELPRKIVMKVKFEVLDDDISDVVDELKELHVEDDYVEDREEIPMLASTWEIEIPIDKERIESMKEVYKINKTVTVHDQKILINSVSILPTRALIDVSFDPDNSMIISGLEGLRLVDDKGEAYASIKNGCTAMGGEDNKVFYIDSSYFKKPENLYLEFDGFRGIDKKYEWVEVDLFNKKVLSDLGEYVTFEGIETGVKSNQYSLRFDVKRDGEASVAQIFSTTFEDLEGKQYHSNSQSSWTNDDEMMYSIAFKIEKEEFEDDFDGKIKLKRVGVTDRVDGKVSFSINE